MSDSAASLLDALLRTYYAGKKLVLLFDYDGTLTPIVEHPSLARLAPETRELLQQLAGQPRLFLGILSGRALDDLREIVGLAELYYAGASGLELDLRGTRIQHPEAEKGRVLIESVVAELATAIDSYAGAWVENKRLAFTLHYRSVAPEQIRELLTQALRTLRPYTHELCLVEGPLAIEVTPSLGWTKGTAVRAIVESIGGDALPLYAGDEANDEEALAAAHALGGFTLGIGANAPSFVTYHLPTPATLGGLLERLHTALTQPSIPTPDSPKSMDQRPNIHEETGASAKSLGLAPAIPVRFGS